MDSSNLGSSLSVVVQGQYWRQYAEIHMEVGDDDAVKSVFSRCLPPLRDIDLWRSYLRYITLTNEDRGGPGYEDIRKAYDFSLDHIGEAPAVANCLSI
jgi:cleavage stimulation factor subunit 3